MSGLSFLVSCTADKPYAPTFLKEPGTVKSNAVAMAIVDRGELALEDVTAENLRNPASGVPTASEVIGIVRELQLAGKATYLPKGHLNGKMPKFEQFLQTKTYGNAPAPKPTGEGTVKFEFDYEHFFATQSVEWFNWLRQNVEDSDVVIWTDKTVMIITDEDIVWDVPGYELTGNSNENIDGSFGFMYIGQGQPVPYFGVISKDLFGYTALTIADPTLDEAKLAKATCSSDCIVFDQQGTAGALTTTLDFNVTGSTACLKWYLYPDCSNTVVGSGDTAQININTGIVTVTAQASNTKKRYRVVAVSNAGLMGEYCMEIVTKAA